MRCFLKWEPEKIEERTETLGGSSMPVLTSDGGNLTLRNADRPRKSGAALSGQPPMRCMRVS